MIKQIGIWAAVFIGTFLIIGGMIYVSKKNESGASDSIKGVALEYAKSLNLDTTKFSSDYDSQELKNKIQEKITEGNKVPITYTPTFFINGIRIDNPRNVDDFKNTINQALKDGVVSPSAEGNVKITDYINDADWVRGDKTSKVVVTEYSDFQCPACGAYYPMVEQINKELGDKIAFVYRHFPLVNIHQFAEPMARAAEAAGKQGKFWEMYSLIFTNQSKWAH